MFISAVYGVLYRSVCVKSGGLCSPGCGRDVCSGGSWWRFKLLGVVCVFVIKSLHRLFITSVILCIESQMITAHSSQPLPHIIYFINCEQLQKHLFYCRIK